MTASRSTTRVTPTFVEGLSVVADHHDRALVRPQRRDERLVRGDVEVVRGLVERQQLEGGAGQEERCEGGPEQLAARPATSRSAVRPGRGASRAAT
ncbi:MAG: hypothetical protein ACYC1E_04435 [Propionibacteriaceae bacterium]